MILHVNISSPTELRAQLISRPPWVRRGRCSCSPLARCRTFPSCESGGYFSSVRFRVLGSTKCSGGLLPPPGVWRWQRWQWAPHWKRRKMNVAFKGQAKASSSSSSSSSLVSWRVAARTRIDQTPLCSRRRYTSLSSSCPSLASCTHQACT